MKIVYFGGYRGEENLGDEAMAINIFDVIKSFRDQLNVTVMINRNGTLLPYDGVSYVDTFFSPNEKLINRLLRFRVVNGINYIVALLKACRILIASYMYQLSGRSFMLTGSERETIDAIKKADCVIIGGGGTINDIASITGVYATSLLCMIAHQYQKRVIVTGQGIGPLNTPINRFLIRRAFGNVSAIGLRDPRGSSELLIELGVERGKLYPTGDDACSLKCIGRDELLKILAVENICIDAYNIGVSVRDTNCTNAYSHTELAEFAELLDRLIATFDATVVFIPTLYKKRDDDRDSAFRILKLIKNKKSVRILTNKYHSKEIKSVIGRMNIQISFTYHPLVFALSQGVPALGLYNSLYYKRKVTGLLDWFGQGDCAIDLHSLDTAEIVKRIDDLNRRQESVRSMLLEAENEMNSRIRSFIGKNLL